MPKYILYFLIVSLLASCSMDLQPFTESQRTANNWTNEDLSKIQFYLSESITLQRKLSGGSSEIASGKVRIVDGERIEEVVIPKGTPGVVVFNSVDQRLGISFEDGEDRYLMFGVNPNKGDKYHLLASEWKNQVGKVKYEDKEWFTNPNSGSAHLLIDLKKVYQRELNRRTAGGRKLE